MNGERQDNGGIPRAIRHSMERVGDQIRQLPNEYELTDISPFATSAAVYFMDGYSDATVQLRESGEILRFEFHDQSTSIAASSPFVHRAAGQDEVFVPAPPPLRPVARAPFGTPETYQRSTATHAMQVISMDMRGVDGHSRLLIGLPYAELHPEIFFRSGLFEGGDDAQSYGVVQSLTEFVDPELGEPSVRSNGYPARSFFAIYHLIETPIGALFNKRASQMELQPSSDGKLALSLPPIPFEYTLMNGPIPLYAAEEPDGPPLGDVTVAHHRSGEAAQFASEAAWPWHAIDLVRISAAREHLSDR